MENNADTSTWVFPLVMHCLTKIVIINKKGDPQNISPSIVFCYKWKCIIKKKERWRKKWKKEGRKERKSEYKQYFSGINKVFQNTGKIIGLKIINHNVNKM